MIYEHVFVVKVLLLPRSIDRLEDPKMKLEGAQGERRGVSISEQDDRLPTRTEVADEIEDKINELLSILSPYDPRAVLGSLYVRNHPSTVEQAHVVFVEYMAALYLTEAWPTDTSEFVVPLDVLEDMQERIFRLFTEVTWSKALPRLRGQSGGPLDELQFLAHLESLWVRYPTYTGQLVDSLEAINRLMTLDLRSVLGWNLTDAVVATGGALALVEDRTMRYLDQARTTAEEILRDVKLLRKRRLDRTRFPMEFLQMLAGLKPSEAKVQAAATAMQWVCVSTKEILLVSPSEVSELTGLDTSIAQAVMRDLCIRFGDVDRCHYRRPAPTTPLQVRPFIMLSEDRYLAPLPGHLPWAIKPAVEELLKPESSSCRDATGRAWHAYEEARKEYLETRSVQLLAEALKVTGYTNLKYVPKSGDPAGAELDGLLILDDVLLLIEAKAGSLPSGARRGAPSVGRELEKLIGKAHEQALRAREFIFGVEDTHFELPGDEELHLEPDDFSRTVLLTVTLDTFDAFSGDAAKLREAGVLRDGDLPWIVSVFDLEVIAESIEGSWQLMHFLTRRFRESKVEVHASGELEFFGCYLKQGLFFDYLWEEDHPCIVHLTTFDEIFDPHFQYLPGSPRPRPSIPRQPIPEEMRRVLQVLDQRRPHGFLHIAEAILDCSTDTQHQLVDGIRTTIKKARLDHNIHDFSLHMENGTGLTFICAPDLTTLEERLAGYCRLKKYQSRSTSWVGFGCTPASREWIDLGVVWQGAWEPDPELDRVLAALGPESDGKT